MAHITVDDANAWLESTKLDLSALDANLEEQVSDQVLATFAEEYDVSQWVDDQTTPALVRSIIAMNYVAWVYDKTYSDDSEANAYATLLRQTANANTGAILAGRMIMPDADPTTGPTASQPAFFPNDQSSAASPTTDFPSDGGPAFLMGQVF